MKNIAVLSVLVIILSANSYAEENEKNYRLSLGPQLGFIYGQAQEIVYSVPEETKNEFLSELLWDMKPVFYIGVQGEYGRSDLMKAPGFFSSVSLKLGFPADSGDLEDRDWMWPSNSDLTRFSSHTNRTNTFIQLDAAAGASFPIKSILYLKPFIAGSWTRFSFAGRDGYGIYNDWNPKEQNYSGLKVITYQQDWLLMAFGLKAGTKIFYPFSFEVSFQISPFTYCAATDNHLLGNTVFKDFTSWGLFIEPSLKMSFAAKTADFSLGASYRNIGNTKGYSYVNKKDTGFQLVQNKAGAGLSMWDINFLAGFRL